MPVPAPCQHGGPVSPRLQLPQLVSSCPKLQADRRSGIGNTRNRKCRYESSTTLPLRNEQCTILLDRLSFSPCRVLRDACAPSTAVRFRAFSSKVVPAVACSGNQPIAFAERPVRDLVLPPFLLKQNAPRTVSCRCGERFPIVREAPKVSPLPERYAFAPSKGGSEAASLSNSASHSRFHSLF